MSDWSWGNPALGPLEVTWLDSGCLGFSQKTGQAARQADLSFSDREKYTLSFGDDSFYHPGTKHKLDLSSGDLFEGQGTE